jgi:hypothetical protein
MKNIYAYDSDGITIMDDDRNTWLSLVDGGDIGIATTDVEAWTIYGAVEFPLGAIAYRSDEPSFVISNNAYYDGAWKYKSTEQAAQIALFADGNAFVRTAVSGTIDTAITWVYKLKIDNATDSAGIGGYAGGFNRDSYFYLATDTYAFWDEDTGELTIYVEGTGSLKIEDDGIGIGGYASGSDQNTEIRMASNAWILWDETSEDFEFNCAGHVHCAITSGGINLGGAVDGSNTDQMIDFATDARIFWYEAGNIFRVNKTFAPEGTGTEDLGTSSRYWGEVNYKSLTDRSALWIEDPDKAWDILKNARNEETTGFCAKVESRGQHRLKYSDFPDYCWDPALHTIEKDIEYDDENDVIIEASFVSQNIPIPQYKKNQTIAKKGEASRLIVERKKDRKTGKEHREISMTAQGFDLSAGVSVLFGGVKKCIEKIEELQEKIEALERKIDGEV